MSNRQTQFVSPLTRKQNNSTFEQPAQVSSEIPELESQPSLNVPTGMAANSDDQSIINLLKTIVENQQMQATLIPSFAKNQAHATYGHNCQCQMHLHNCQNHVQNLPSEHLTADSPAINDDTSLKNLLITMLKNQTQPGSAYAWNQGHTYLRHPSLQPCNMHCQQQVHSQSLSNVPTSTTSANSEDQSTRTILMTILKNQMKMNAQLEYLIHSQEQIIKKIDSIPPDTLNIPTRITFKKIDSVQDCHEFEENLKNVEFAQRMIKHFESVCGANSDLYGDNVAYTLVDQIFSRRLFTLVSWTGLSRGTESKESFLKFERIFQFFFDLVRRVDSQYSIKSLKDFFQKIISNSKRRFEHKRSRTSRVKLSSLKKNKISLPDKEISFERRNSNVYVEQEFISDEITDNDDELKDNISVYSFECLEPDEVTTNSDVNYIKVEDD